MTENQSQKMNFSLCSLAMMMAAVVAFSSPLLAQKSGGSGNKTKSGSQTKAMDSKETKTQIATFGGGCFWCVESVFEQLEGVSDVVSGYEGDEREQYADPSYELICSKKTKHAEVCQITFDPSVITYEQLLEVFFQSHNPTTLNRQGPDAGPQYRSVIFSNSEEQQKVASAYVEKLTEKEAFGDKEITTEVTPSVGFFRAEEYHQDYFAKNPDNAYCTANALPKVLKIKKKFSDRIKK